MAGGQDLFNLPGQYDNPGLYDPDKQKKAGKNLIPEQTAAAGQPTGVKEAEEAVKNRSDTTDRDLTSEKLKAAESSGKDQDLYNSEEPTVEKKVRFSRGKKVAVGVGGAGIVGIVISTVLISQIYHVPIHIGSLNNNMFSSRMMRRITERGFEKVLYRYLASKAIGDLGTTVKEGSALDKLYKTFDKVDLAGRMGAWEGLEWIKKPNGVRLHYRGRDIGPANTSKESLKTIRGNREASKAMNRILSDRIPIYSILRAGSLRMFAYQFVRNFFADYNKNKTREENVDQFNENQVAEVKDDSMKTFGGVLDCLTADQCDKLDKDNTQPVKTDTRPANGLDLDVGAPENKEAQGVSDTVNDSYEETKDEIPSKKTNFMDRMIARIVEKVIGAAAAKTVAAAIPFVGPIDLLAQIQHALGVAFSKKLITKTSVLIKQQQYAAIGALWLGYGDQIKRGSMQLSFIDSLNSRLFDTSLASSSKYLAGKDPSTGVPVDPKVGSNIDYTTDDILDFLYGRLGLIGRLPLEIWYNTVGKLLGAIGELGGSIVGWIASITGANAAFNNAMVAAFGEHWEEKLAEYAIKTLIHIFGLDIDALASGPALTNNIYTGLDVLNNRYLEQNVGGKEISPRETKLSATQAEAEHRQYLSNLPLKERLFSLDNTDSVASKVVGNLPSSYRPATLVPEILGQIAQLPAALLTMFTGHTFALSAAESANLNGQAQFGGSEAEIDMDIPENMTQDADPVCEPNDPTKFNNCQRYKELIEGVAPCLYSNCPQFEDNTATGDTGE